MAKPLYAFDGPNAARVAAATRKMEREPLSRPRHQAHGPVIVPDPIIVAKITGGTNPYSAVEVVPGEDGTWTTKTDGIEWDAAGDNPLYERNDNESVPVDTIVVVSKAFVADDQSLREWVFDASSSVPQSGTGVPTHAAAAGTFYFNTSTFTVYINWNGSTGWTTILGTPYDYLGRLVYTRQAITGTTTISANHRVQHTLGGTGPYTVTHVDVSGLDAEHYAFIGLDTLTGIVTLDGNGTQEFRGPRGSGANARTRKYVRDEHVFMEGDGAHWRILAETMLEVGCHASNSAPQNLGGGAPVQLQFDTLDLDINSGFASHTMTPLAPGTYRIAAGATYESLGDGERGKLFIYKNGSLHKTLANIAVGAAGDLSVSGACEVVLNGSTDTVQVYGEHDNGGSIAVSGVYFHASRIRRDES